MDNSPSTLLSLFGAYLFQQRYPSATDPEFPGQTQIPPRISPMQPKIPIRVPQACDACRARKVKCNGQQPCPPCEHLNLHCKFSGKRGSGGGNKARVAPRRNRVLTQLRSTQAGGQRRLRDLRASTVAPTLAGSEVGASDPSPGTVVEDSARARERAWLLSLLPLYQCWIDTRVVSYCFI